MTIRWLLAIAIVGGLVGVGLTFYTRLKSEQDDLLASIAQTNKTIESFRAVDLSPLKEEIGDLQSRGLAAEAYETSLSQRYRSHVHSIEIQERLYRLAEESGCVITSIGCTGPTAEESGGIRFESYSLSIDAQAAVPPSLLGFLMKVSDAYDSGVIGAVNMSIPRPPTEGSTETTTTVSFQLRVIYLPQEGA